VRNFVLIVVVAAFFRVSAMPQDGKNPAATTPPAAPQTQNQQPSPPAATITLPEGTKLPLALVRPLSVKHAKPGDNVYLQINFPVTVGTQMVIPPAAYVQGVIERIVKRDRARELLEFEMRSATLIFSTGYTVSIAGTVRVVPGVAEFRQAAPETRPALAAFGSDIEMPAGTPLQIVLTAPLVLDRERVLAAIQQYSGQMASAQPPVVQPPPQKPKLKMCHAPAITGTPDTVIPGNAGTPPTIIPGINGAPPTVIPGTPPTPPTVIPGTPGTPARDYPCK
jgi:hypothetical protein